MNRDGFSRRAFIGGLAALPVIWSRAMADDAPTPSLAFSRVPPPITSAGQMLNVMEFEARAREALPPAHFGFIATGADDDRTVVRNHEAYAHYEIRAHRFNDISHIDTSRSVYGTRWATPLYLSAVSSMRAFHPDAEIAVAGAAGAGAAHE